MVAHRGMDAECAVRLADGQVSADEGVERLTESGRVERGEGTGQRPLLLVEVAQLTDAPQSEVHAGQVPQSPADLVVGKNQVLDTQLLPRQVLPFRAPAEFVESLLERGVQ